MRNDTPQGMKCNVTFVAVLFHFFFSFVPCGRKEARICISLLADRKAEDGQYRLRLSVIP